MDYLEFTFSIQPVLPAREILIAELAELGFDSFVESEDGLKAYIQVPGVSEKEIRGLIAFGLDDVAIEYSQKCLPRENWNAKWESEFEPIMVHDDIVVAAPFHTDLPQAKHHLLIQPKMSFGTGHHDTTWLMLKHLLELDLRDKHVLDMGSGTGILAIMAEKLGASEIDAIDIDDWAETNARENAELNDCSRIRTFTGDAQLLGKKSYDLVLANINRNVLQADLPKYVEVMKPGAVLLLSGFFHSDVDVLHEQCHALGLRPDAEAYRNDWSMLRLIKDI